MAQIEALEAKVKTLEGQLDPIQGFFAFFTSLFCKSKNLTIESAIN